MSKQKVINEIRAFKVDERDLFVYQNNQIDPYKNGFEDAKLKAILAIGKLDEPEKPVVPQFVADWYEDNKRDFEIQVYDLCVKWYEDKLPENLNEWFTLSSNKPIQTLVNMHQFGYEVKKEKLYTVEIPNNLKGRYNVLVKNHEGTIILDYFDNDTWRVLPSVHLTESEIKKDYNWAWDLGFAKEVEE